MPTTRPGTRRIADRARRALRLAGARSTAIWPDEASLSLWALPPAQLTTTLVDLIEHGTGAAAYYADVMEAVVALAVEAPGGFGDADAWYCILEGTAEISVAEAQARAIADILAAYATAPSQDREILLAVDEFSAVSRRLPVWQLYERARSLGLAVQVSAQSREGLAAGEDERYRIAATADGGIWLLRTPHPGGRRRVTARLGEFRVCRGRPARLALRILLAMAAGAAAVLAAGPHPAAPALVTGIATWLALTARHDLAPPGRH